MKKIEDVRKQILRAETLIKGLVIYNYNIIFKFNKIIDFKFIMNNFFFKI